MCSFVCFGNFLDFAKSFSFYPWMQIFLESFVQIFQMKIITQIHLNDPSFSSPSATSSSTQSIAPAKATSQPIQIPEIPPFRKHENQHSNYPPPPASQSTVSMSVSPPKISEIPPFKQRKSKDFVHTEQHSQDGSHPEHQLTIGPSGGAEWTRRLKVAETSPIHRSTDCIVSKELGTSSDSELMKPAPSWINIASKTEQAGTSKIIDTFTIMFPILFKFIFKVQALHQCQKQLLKKNSVPLKLQQRSQGSSKNSWRAHDQLQFFHWNWRKDAQEKLKG